ncbi:MAG: acylphosphatase [Rhodanobacteraceae bacterium]
MPCARFIVSGHVQGVYFRASARTEALRLGIGGYARNLADGRVEVMACSEVAALDALQTWLRHGPANARVESVIREDLPEQTLVGFRAL